MEGFKLWKTAPVSGAATVSISGGSLTVTAGDAFYVTGTTGNPASAAITVAGGTTIRASSGNIPNVDGGSTASLSIDGDTLTGNLIADNTSTITATLKNGAALTGYINVASLSLDGTSTWALTTSSYLKTLTDAPGVSGTSVTNIIGNGHSLHYDSTLSGNKYLGGKIYSLVNGGFLTPGSLTSATQGQQAAPATIALRQNYPNPFNPTTTISFDIPARSHTLLAVYDMLGRRIAVLIDGMLDAGTYTAPFDGTRLASGIYFYRLEVAGAIRTGKMVLQR
ncbi:MAG TPA: T9SS type A sorting domain-containing protein [Bacteroidota bacterium]|nr:T9SS type A sorting domain-containing protein [Bacteroidota bacterium]